MEKPKNTEIKYIIIGVSIIIVGIFLIFLPSITNMDMFNGGFALIFMSIALIIPAGIITAVIYLSRAKALAKILDKKDFLAHWTFTRHEWDKYTNEEKKREHEAKIGLWYLLIVISAVICIGFFIWADDKKAALFSIGVIAGVIIFIRILIYLTGRNAFIINKKYLGEVYIGKIGVLINRTFHSWNNLSKLEDVQIDEKAYLMIISYSAPSNHGRDYFTANVPIPKGKEKEAERIARVLMK